MLLELFLWPLQCLLGAKFFFIFFPILQSMGDIIFLWCIQEQVILFRIFSLLSYPPTSR